MQTLNTKYFGQISYGPDATVEFPNGLPGFDQSRQFVVVQMPHAAPMVFLQSLDEPGLCFMTLPILAADPEYRLRVADEDLAVIGLPRGRQPRIGEDVLCVAIVSAREEGPTANLLAPILVNLKNRKGIQAVAQESSYSHQHPLIPREAEVCS